MPYGRIDCKIEITELTRDTIKFVLYNTDLSVANALRRVMMSEVPTLAIDNVFVNNNTSVLTDEFICHRLGLVPLVSTAADLFHYPRDCSCMDGECSNCAVILRLHVHNTGTTVMNVTTHNLISDSEVVKPVHFRQEGDEDHEHRGSSSSSSSSSSSASGRGGGGDEDDGILICKLKPGQEVDMKCIARKGVGKLHAKWSASCAARFMLDPSVVLNDLRMEMLDETKKAAFVDTCPQRVFELNELTRRVVVRREAACIFCGECEKIAEDFSKATLVTVASKPERFLFTVESTGVMPPEDIVLRAISVLKAKLTSLQVD